jgi:hypothetical protein
MNFLQGIADDVRKGAQTVHDTVSRKVSKTKSRAMEFAKPRPAETSRDYASQVAKAIPGDVKMFSGCMDSQTSADVSDVSSFGLPPVNGPEKAGGACTNALLAVHQQTGGSLSFGDLLIEMQKVLKKRRYTQIPQLSSSKQVDLKQEKFSVTNKNPSGRTRALLIGINYFGQKGELSGCVNDVKQMKAFIVSRGFNPDRSNMRVLTDDPSCADAPPTGENIINAIRWLVEGAQAGDSLFFHYSGHGGQIPDDNGDEEDGMDETLIPVDYVQHGQIRDDDIFKLLVLPLREGVSLVAVFDCCHSGTILDLPYTFAAGDAGCQAYESGSVSGLGANPFFNLGAVLEMVGQAIRGLTGAARSLLK